MKRRSMIGPTLAPCLVAFALAFTPACADDADSGSMATPSVGNPGSTGLSQAGAQDFGLFRDILDRGELPGPDTLDDLGFFAEHKLDYPAASCGDTGAIPSGSGVCGWAWRWVGFRR